MSTFSIIVISIIVLHLIAGFGWLIYKLSPRKEQGKEKDKDKSKTEL
ncbi:hypothetical protein [Aequorivita sp. CIP111184]|nr:hypothetical protein [Aequorivita sp. CIP111184]SRX55974.1 hypothetical protein AEQU1_03000 [Aequorivita sp. CIP111184]